MCVKKCPTKDSQQVDCFPNKDLQQCGNVRIYDSYGFIGRLCVPSTEFIFDSIKKIINVKYFTEMLEDIVHAWWVFIVCFVLSIILCVVYYWMLKSCTGCFVWVMISFGLLSIFAAGGYY